MAGFSKIIGHESTIQHLRQALAADRVAHAYLIEGEDGSGKKLIAQTFAEALQCQQLKDDACGECVSCHKAASHNHPDILYVTHEKPNLISVGEIRSQLVGDVQVRPYESPYKVYIVEDAEKMNTEAQNALLKTLEEPPEYAVILLLTVNAQSLLETIRSRCVKLELKPVKDELVEAYLMEHLQIPDYQARLCLAFAQGSIGKAMELASSESFAQIRSTAVMLVSRAREMEISQLAGIVREMTQYKVTIRDFLDILAVWYRDVLYCKATTKADALIFRDQLQQIRQTARTSSYEGIETILEAIRVAQRRLEANVNFDLTMELLFMTIKEN